MSRGNWYLAVIVACITVLAGGAAFYLTAFVSGVDVTFFQTTASAGAGGLLTLLVQQRTQP